MKKLANYIGIGLALGMMLTLLPLPATDTAEAYTFTQFMRLGSRSVEVMELQKALNLTSCKVATTGAGSPGFETTYFGPRTLAAVRCFQAANNLAVDGIVGPITRAALNAIQPGGQLPQGCLPGYMFSPITGQRCVPTTGNLPPGCTSTSGFSPVTGERCDVNVPDDDDDGDDNDGPLQGGAGSITVDKTSDFSDEEVGEGEDEAGVLSFEIEADDSDVEITSMRIEFHQGTSTDDEDMADYLESVAIFMGDEMVGESDMDDFSEDSDTFTDTIEVDNAVIREGNTEEFSVRVTALNSLDSGDIDSAVVNVGVSNIRFLDGDGVSTTESFTLDVSDDSVDDTLEESFTFGTFASSTDLELRISLSDDDEINEAHVLNVDDTDDTDDVEILSFDIEVEGDSDVTIDEIPVEITTGGANIDDMISRVCLSTDGDELGCESISATDTDETIVFDELDFTIDSGDTVNFVVTVDINDLDATGGAEVEEGDTIQAQITSTERDLIEAEDESGEDIDTSDMTGTATGETHTIFDAGINVSFVESSFVRNTSDTAGINETVQFTLVFDVTAFDDDIWVEKSCIDDASPSASHTTDVVVSLDGDTNGDNTTCVDLDSTGDEGTFGFEVLEGQTERFTVTILGNAAEAGGAGNSVTFRARLEAIGFNVGTDAAGDLQYSFNLDDFTSSAVTVFDR